MPGRKKSYGKAGDREKAASGTRHRKQSKEIKREKTESPPVALRRDSAGSGLDLDEPLTPTPANRKKKVSEQSSEREDDGWTIIPYPGDVLSPPPGVGAKGDNWAGKKGIGMCTLLHTSPSNSTNKSLQGVVANISASNARTRGMRGHHRLSCHPRLRARVSTSVVSIPDLAEQQPY